MIEKICLLCANNDVNPLSKYYHSVDKIDVFEDINNGKYENLFDYITQKSFKHFYHENCSKKKKIKKEKKIIKLSLL